MQVILTHCLSLKRKIIGTSVKVLDTDYSVTILGSLKRIEVLTLAINYYKANHV